MILCDANVFIHAFNGNEKTIATLKIIGLQEIVLSAITLMELYQGMGNKSELAQRFLFKLSRKSDLRLLTRLLQKSVISQQLN